MAETIVQGPLVSGGSLLNNNVVPTDGPEIQYQGSILPDPRFSPMAKDGMAPGRVKGYALSPAIAVVDAIPSMLTTANIAAAQAPSTTAGIALTLATAQLNTAAGVAVPAPGIPFIPLGTSRVVTAIAIDFGFTTATTVANSSTLAVVDNALFSLGQWLVIPGVNGTTTAALITQVQSISTNTTVITVLPTPLTALSNVPVGQGNLYSQLLPPASQFGPAAASANASEPYHLAGFGLAFDPAQGIARALTAQAASIGSGTTSLLVSGYDIYGAPMTELFVCDGTTIQNGKKAFKYVTSVVTTGVAATTVTPANVQVGVSDVFGLPLRSDRSEYLNVSLGGTTSINSVGWVKALSTTSNASTVDVRGTINASTAIASTNGVRRLVIIQSMPQINMLNATPLSTAALYGTPQA